MKAGDLNRRIQVFDRVEGAKTGSGEIPVSYVPSTSIQSSSGNGKVWAQILPVAGQKFFAAAQVQSAVTHMIRVRYQHGFRTSMRVKHETEPGKFQEFDVEAVLPIGMDRTHLNLMCVLRESEGWR